MAIQLHHGDILRLHVDAVVNAANTELQHTGSLAADIAKRGGPTIQSESDKIGWCDIGSAVAIAGGLLIAKHVIHVPTVNYLAHKRASLEEVEQGTRSALQLAKTMGIRSIAFPLLATGIVGFPVKPVARHMLRALREPEFADLDITLCVFWQGGIDDVRGVFGEEGAA
jgi:O-acetyl-ADP-ribose deacetylase (regulator of RNase III)